ncbi:MAG: hypothetical protein J5951_06000 [Bacteroidales bacterium]|nr:hypothetical protein [Bacteroidales bacterium]
MPRRPKFDYDSDAFYDQILALAMQGLTDAEIAYELKDETNPSRPTLGLDPTVFSCMKNGNYKYWTTAQNERRSERINKVLARGRARVNSIVRGAFLKSALGGKVIKTKVKQAVKARCSCRFENDGAPVKDCPKCGGTGWYYVTEQVVVQEVEHELPPDTRALSSWLYHHDKDFRKIERKMEDDEDGIPTDIEQGISIDKWIKDQMTGGKEDAEK